MESIFVSTHLTMLICIAGILYSSISSKNNDRGEEKKPDHHRVVISKSLHGIAAAFAGLPLHP